MQILGAPVRTSVPHRSRANYESAETASKPWTDIGKRAVAVHMEGKSGHPSADDLRGGLMSLESLGSLSPAPAL